LLLTHRARERDSSAARTIADDDQASRDSSGRSRAHHRELDDELASDANASRGRGRANVKELGAGDQHHVEAAPRDLGDVRSRSDRRPPPRADGRRETRAGRGIGSPCTAARGNRRWRPASRGRRAARPPSDGQRSPAAVGAVRSSDTRPGRSPRLVGAGARGDGPRRARPLSSQGSVMRVHGNAEKDGGNGRYGSWPSSFFKGEQAVE